MQWRENPQPKTDSDTDAHAYEKSDYNMENSLKNKKKQFFDFKKFIKMFFVSIILTVAATVTLAGMFLKGNNLENLLYYARVPMSDGSTQAIKNCVDFCLPTAISIFVLANLTTFVILINKNTILDYSKKHKNNSPAKQLYFFYRHSFLISFISLLATVIFFGNQIDAFSYLKGMMRKTQVYEEEYTPPQNQTYQFPEKKKNLIYIFLESMETSFASVEEGGLMEENIIPYLTELAKENISFSDTEVLGGAYAVPGTTWTAAAMVTQTSGIPLTIPISKSNFGQDNKFLPGAYSIGEILEKEGYNQELMVGSKASYAKRRAYFEQHGNYRIFDYYTAIERGEEAGYLPEDYYVWWGFEDQKLFDYAKREILQLYSEGKPFNFTMLTVDTHFTDGYKCELCESNFDNQYANVLRCSDKQIYEFVSWVKEQPFYKDTVIVLSGDHLTMDHKYFDRVDDEAKERGRRIYNCFINTGLSDEHTKNRTFSTLDIFPTTLAALGVTWGSETLGLGVNLFSGEKTQCEKKGVENFSYQLASGSDFYSDYIIDKNLSSKELYGGYEGDTGPAADLDMANRKKIEQQKLLESNSTVDSAAGSSAELEISSDIGTIPPHGAD